MYIRRTTIKSKKDGETYFTHRLVESVRVGNKVKQRTIINLGKNFPFPREQWPDIACRVEGIINGQSSLFKLPEKIEQAAQHYAAQIIQTRSSQNNNTDKNDSIDAPDYRLIDIDSLELIRPRSVSIEHVSHETFLKLQLDKIFEGLGYNNHQIAAAIGSIVGRMAVPGSELSTHYWLQNRSGLGELIGYDYESMSLKRIYEISDRIYKDKEAIERHLYNRERFLFGFEEIITLYDLTNTFFEGSCKYNELGKHGKSKEKRSDCPLVTLALVLDSSGFPRRSKIFSGNVSEPSTLEEMISSLNKPSESSLEDDKQMSVFDKKKPVVVMDAGIATNDNVQWLQANHYRYLVVSRKRHREFDHDKAVEVKRDKDYIVKAYKKYVKETEETEIYCHSSEREKKDQSIQNRFSERFEADLKSLNDGLNQKGRLKIYEKVVEKVGRLKQKYTKAAKNYEITIHKDKGSKKATKITWKIKKNSDSSDSNPGVYCLRTNLNDLDETILWRTYTMLTDLEAVFRSLKSELGLRPVFHQITRRVKGHLFITLLAYHHVHTIRFRLKENGIHTSWSDLRKELDGQNRTTAVMRSKNGETIHVRKSTKAESRQLKIYDALGVPHSPGKVVKYEV
ncbi:transposase [Desulfosarcina ovata subsp. sediminis]|uniref:Transposase n=2 Tax=Desulfosarcina ovata TaxID=83564 RepID=A0A5K7ZKW7_9BACT|nr:transposase [Desulfosarcina ovata subsp. sediminis]BBO80895.1 transposase [Desulfosarcina ovata subsp. sediminis]BBO82710.1 transposase [Desulfosarcina ovata subsp. sediminis]BBO83632.1 transposase [Desulfosarcina ovata subsp. sediminis]